MVVASLPFQYQIYENWSYRRFDFSSQTQSFMNTLSNFTIKVIQAWVVCFSWLLFSSPLATYKQSGILMETWPTRSWLHSFAVLNNDLYCEFAFILVSFEPWMAHNLTLSFPDQLNPCPPSPPIVHLAWYSQPRLKKLSKMTGNFVVDYLMIWKVTHCCKTCKKLVHIATAIGKLYNINTSNI